MERRDRTRAGQLYLVKDLPVECGVNRVLIRSTPFPGDIVLRADGEGLQSAAVTIKSRSFQVQDGLALQMPDQGLEAKLDRGPTPAGLSFTSSRTPLTIKAATAGANGDKAAGSYDDNETTAWNNDGQLSTAWIQYELERVGVIGEIALKLNNFRTRSYPLRVSIDGKEVFNGVTERNLGYYTIHFPSKKGRMVRIELRAGGGQQGMVAGTEVNGKKLDDGVGGDETHKPALLSIIEAEIYAGSGSGIN